MVDVDGSIAHSVRADLHGLPVMKPKGVETRQLYLCQERLCLCLDVGCLYDREEFRFGI
jgi:hypothetical protein